MRLRHIVLAIGISVGAQGAQLPAQQVSYRVAISATHAGGAPAHSAAGRPLYARSEQGTFATLIAVDAQTQWRQVETNSVRAQVVRTYLPVLAQEAEPEAAGELRTDVVGGWNLDWIRDGNSRGVPESTRGGPT